MIPHKFIVNDDLDFVGKWDEQHDEIIINLSKANSECEIVDTIFHEDIHALIGWAMYPKETTADQDHEIIKSLSFG